MAICTKFKRSLWLTRSPYEHCYTILLPMSALCLCGFPECPFFSPLSTEISKAYLTSLLFHRPSVASVSLAVLHLLWMSASPSWSESANVAPTRSQSHKHLLSPSSVPGKICRPVRDAEVKRSSRIYSLSGNDQAAPKQPGNTVTCPLGRPTWFHVA